MAFPMGLAGLWESRIVPWWNNRRKGAAAAAAPLVPAAPAQTPAQAPAITKPTSARSEGMGRQGA
jgi:urea transport system permease protein